MLDIQTILTYLTLISVPVGVFYHIMTLNNTRKNQQQTLETRQAQLFMQLYLHLDGRDMQRNMAEVILLQEWEDPDDFYEKYGPENNLEAAVSYFQLETFFEGLGVLIKKGLIDPSLVDDLMAGDIMLYWEKMVPITNMLRERYTPFWSEHVEYLYNKVKEVYEQQHPELKT